MDDHHDPPTLAQLMAEVAAQRAQQALLLARMHQLARQQPIWRRVRLPRLVAGGLIALLVALVPLALLAANPFTDLNAGSVHNANIDAIYNAGITTGCVPGALYCPNDYVTREQMASFLARTAGIGGNPPVTNALTAVSATSAGNATTVGGYAPSALVRVSRGVPLATFEPPVGSYATGATVTISAPAPGFVLVTGSIAVGRGTAVCPAVNGCGASAHLRHVAIGGEVSTGMLTSVNSAVPVTTLPLTWVFPVTAAGAQTYVLEVSVSHADMGASLGQLAALYVPFGMIGTSALGMDEPAP